MQLPRTPIQNSNAVRPYMDGGITLNYNLTRVKDDSTNSWWRSKEYPYYFVCLSTDKPPTMTESVKENARIIDLPFATNFTYEPGSKSVSNSVYQEIYAHNKDAKINGCDEHPFRVVCKQCNGVPNVDEFKKRQLEFEATLDGGKAKAERDEKIAENLYLAVNGGRVPNGVVREMLKYIGIDERFRWSESLPSKTRLDPIVLNEGTPHKNINSIKRDPKSLTSLSQQQTKQGPNRQGLSSKTPQPRGLE